MKHGILKQKAHLYYTDGKDEHKLIMAKKINIHSMILAALLGKY